MNQVRSERSGRSDRSNGSPRSPSTVHRKRLRPSGGYRDTCSFQTATIIYDATYWFCEKFVDSRSRTVDQMIQAARSGQQNIAEGSRAAATSSQTELRLLNTARSSLEELLLDYEDYLRHRHLPKWEPDSPEAMAVRQVPRDFRRNNGNPSNPSDLTDLTDHERWALYSRWLDHKEPAVRANAILCLINQANYLLDKQITALEEAFVTEGGYSEQLATARLVHRECKREADGSDPPNPSDRIPPCPRCSKSMVLRTARSGKNSGQQFWGCSAYPECKAVVSV
jgi:four helix bundle suffix protein